MQSHSAVKANKTRADVQQNDYARFFCCTRFCEGRLITPSAILLTELGLTSLRVV